MDTGPGTITSVRLDLRDTTAVLLPGAGSDESFVRRAFGGPLTAAGARPVAHRPNPGDLIGGYVAELDQAADRQQTIIIAGVSIGAAVAIRWAVRNPQRALTVLAAMPPWTGPPDTAPAAQAARHSAARLRRHGIAAVLAEIHATSPAWLATELTRSWRALWPGLPDSLDQAASYPGPRIADLARLRCPLVVVAAVDDPLHPLNVAVEWSRSAPEAELRTLTLDEIGADPTLLGANCLAALAAIAAKHAPAPGKGPPRGSNCPTG